MNEMEVEAEETNSLLAQVKEDLESSRQEVTELKKSLAEVAQKKVDEFSLKPLLAWTCPSTASSSSEGRMDDGDQVVTLREELRQAQQEKKNDCLRIQQLENTINSIQQVRSLISIFIINNNHHHYH